MELLKCANSACNFAASLEGRCFGYCCARCRSSESYGQSSGACHGPKCLQHVADGCATRANVVLNAHFPTSSSLKGLVETDSTVEAADAIVSEGFTILADALDSRQVAEVLGECQRIGERVRHEDSAAVGNRGQGRYSFKSVAGPDTDGNLFHLEAWTRHLLDNSKVLDVLDKVFGPPGDDGRSSYVAYHAGGDFCLGSACGYQFMHSDWTVATRGTLGAKSSRYNPLYSVTTPPLICVNFLVQPLTRWNGAMRIVPWSQMVGYGSLDPPNLNDEYENTDWLASKLFPQMAGVALIRDVRVWHGGTPNSSGQTRYLPAIMFMSRAAFEWQHKGEDMVRALPNALFESISKRAQSLCTEIHASSPDDEVNEMINKLVLRRCIANPASHYSVSVGGSVHVFYQDAVKNALISAHQLECDNRQQSEPVSINALCNAFQNIERLVLKLIMEE